MEKQSKILRCMPKIMIGGGSVDYDLHVLTLKAEVIPQYEFMCAAIDALRVIDLIDTLEQIEVIESGKATDGSTGLDAYAAMFDKNKAWFWCEFGPTGEEVEGGQVNLAQFKLAVQTYLRFLQDPERKPIEVVFPD